MNDSEIRARFNKIYRKLNCTQSCIGISPSGICDPTLFLNQCGEFVAGGAGGSNIYNTDGTLTSDRTLTQSTATGDYDLTFTALSSDGFGSFEFFNKPSISTIGLSYVSTQTETTGGINYDSGSGNAFYFLNNLDVATNNEASITVQYDRTRIAFLDFATEPNQKNSVEVLSTGIIMEGNKNDTSSNTEWSGYDGAAPVILAHIYNKSQWN